MESRILGDYTLIKQIGQGSLGTVYLAEHRFMKKQYVLKVLPQELSTDRGFIQRFEDGVGLLASLDHTNIVKIHNISFAQGQHFLVIDCIVDEMGETTNLAQYMLSRGKRFEEEELFRLLRQVADALDYAHNKKSGGKGILHRGIKLNNILVGKGKGGIDLYLSDFGLSRIIGTGAVLSRTYKNVAEALGIGTTINSSKTELEKYPSPAIDYKKLIPLHASFLQTFAFLAPEQRRLDYPQPVDFRADNYAFGILAYYLLMGEFPEGIFEMPSTRIPDYIFDWDSLIGSCLSSNPAHRPELLIPALEAIRTSEKNNKETLYLPKIDDLKMQVPEMEISEFNNLKPPLEKKQKEQSYCYATAEVKEENLYGGSVDNLSIDNSNAGVLRPIIQTTQLERPQTDLDPASIFQIDTSVKHYIPERKEEKIIQPLLTEMVVIQGGNFYRGSNDGNRDEMPRHQVSLSSFAIDIHPVTNEQFVRFLEVMGGEKDSNHLDIIRMRDSRIKRSGGRLSIESGYTKHPVVGVTWYGAVAYAKWVGKRLPSEAEWEIAARGGLENDLYPCGEDIEKSEANFFSSDTTAVMSYAPNGYGLFDMAGNVYEWCHDWYGYNYYESSIQEPENPKGPLQGAYRILRGGCWKSLKEDLRCSRRNRNNPGTVNGTYGFRCSADVGI
jgi:formylglycine-generating enzyme required for sulfatase activity